MLSIRLSAVPMPSPTPVALYLQDAHPIRDAMGYVAEAEVSRADRPRAVRRSARSRRSPGGERPASAKKMIAVNENFSAPDKARLLQELVEIAGAGPVRRCRSAQREQRPGRPSHRHGHQAARAHH